jgi:hypothetical protein
LANYGNTSAASIPLSLSLKNSAKPFQTGERILMTAAGAGMTEGALVVEMQYCPLKLPKTEFSDLKNQTSAQT